MPLCSLTTLTAVSFHATHTIPRLFFDTVLAYSKTDEFKEDMKLRPHIERVIAGLVLHNGARRARFRGQEKVDYQMKMCGTVYNLKRWVALLRDKRLNRQPKKRRRFADLPPTTGGVGLTAA